MHLATSTAHFLGYTLTQGGYTVDAARCKIVKDNARPQNERQIKRFLGIAQYFKKLLKNYSQRTEPLHRLLEKDVEFVWTDKQECSFCDIRDALCSAPVLGYPDESKPMRIILEA